MEGFGDHGLFVNEGGQDNVYQNLLASIDRRNLLLTFILGDKDKLDY